MCMTLSKGGSKNANFGIDIVIRMLPGKATSTH